MEYYDRLLNAYGTEYATLRDSVDCFRQGIQQQRDEDKKMVKKIAADRDVALDAAFLSLEHLTKELLAIEDGDALVGHYALPSLPKTVTLFHQLSTTCESAVDRIGEEFVDTTQYGGENRQLKAKLAEYEVRISSDTQGCANLRGSVVKQLETHHQTVHTTEEELRKAQDKQSGFVYDLFGDSEIDSQVETNIRAFTNARDLRDRVVAEADRLWRMQNDLNKLRGSVSSLTSDLDGFFHEMNAEYSKLVDGRKRDEHCWSTTRALDYHVSTSGPDTSRNDILRHVLLLVNVMDEEIDGDKDVQLSKKEIKASIFEKLGEGEYCELQKEKKFLETESNDF